MSEGGRSVTVLQQEIISEGSSPPTSSVNVRMISAVTGEPFGPRVKQISEQLEEASSDDEPDSESPDESRILKDEFNADVPPEFWHMQKLIKYMKAGNQTATTVALCLLKDFDLTSKVLHRVILEMGGLEILVNLLETTEIKCQHGSLAVMLRLSESLQMRKHLVDLGVVTALINLLKHPARDIQVLTVETLSNIALLKKARKQIRIRGGIPLIIDCMDVPDNVIRHKPEKLNESEAELLAVGIGCAKVLNSMSSSPKIKEELRKHGVLFILARFLKSHITDLVVPTMGAVQQMSDMKVFRLAFERMEIINDIVRHLTNDNVKLKENCALAIFKCAESGVSRDMIRQAGGLDPLCKLVKNEEVQKNKKLLAAVTGAIWKCAQSPENVERFNESGLISILVEFLNEDEDETVLTNVVGAIAECCKNEANRDMLRSYDGLPKLIKLLNATHEPLLQNIPLVIAECAQNERCMDEINDPEHKLDGVRLVWSLLKHSSNAVKRNACLALVPCIRYAKNSAEMVRAFVGGLELVVHLLESEDNQVLSAACATIAAIATDSENLGILSDHEVVKKLAKLVNTEDDYLRANLTLAIAYCSEYGSNNYEFGRLNAVAPLINYAHSKDPKVLKGVCIAFYHLSKEPSNCVTMHNCGVVKHVLRLVGSEDVELQIAAATTIRNTRKLALTAEKFHYQEISTLSETDFLS